MPAVFLFIILLIYAIMFIFIFPYWKSDRLVIANCTIGFLTLFFWIISLCTNPGIINKPHDIEFLVSYFYFLI